MGVHDLWKLLGPSGVTTRMTELDGKTVAIDTSIWLHQFSYGSDVFFLQPHVRVLRGFFQRIVKLLFFNIKPVFVFDGKPPLIKAKTLQKRRTIADKGRITKYAKKLFKIHHEKGEKEKKKKKRKRKSKSSIVNTPNNDNIIVIDDDNDEKEEEENNEINGMMNVFSFAKRGEETGFVHFGALKDEDFDKDEEEEEEDGEDGDVESVLKRVLDDGEVNEDNFWKYNSSIKREVLKVLKEREKMNVNMMKVSELNAYSPEEFSQNQHDEMMSKLDENNIERKVLTSIMNGRNEGINLKGNTDSEIISSGVLASNRDIGFELIDDKVSDKIVEKKNKTKQSCNDSNNVEKNENKNYDFFGEICEKANVSTNNENDISKGENDDIMNILNNKEEDVEERENLFEEIGSLLDDFNDEEEDVEEDVEEEEEIIEINDENDENNGKIESEVSVENDINRYEIVPKTDNLSEDNSIYQNVRVLSNPNNEVIEEQRMNINLVVRNELISGIEELLKICGIPFLHSPYEADSQCGYLYKHKLVDAVVTEDSDVFLFGAGKVYRHVFSRTEEVKEYNLASIKSNLGLDKIKLIQLALLLGSDYSEGVRNVGIVNGTQIIDAFNEKYENSESDIERIKSPLKSFRKWVLDDSKKMKRKVNETKREWFKRNYHHSKNRFVIGDDFPSDEVINAYLNPSVDESKESFSWPGMQYEELYEFALKYMCWTTDDVDRIINPLKEEIEKRRREGNQMRMDSFVTRRKKFAFIKSKRLKKAISHLTGKEKKSEEKKKTSKKKKKKKSKRKKRKRIDGDHVGDERNKKKRKKK